MEVHVDLFLIKMTTNKVTDNRDSRTISKHFKVQELWPSEILSHNNLSNSMEGSSKIRPMVNLIKLMANLTKPMASPTRLMVNLINKPTDNSINPNSSLLLPNTVSLSSQTTMLSCNIHLQMHNQSNKQVPRIKPTTTTGEIVEPHKS